MKTVYNYLRFGCLPTGLLLVLLGAWLPSASGSVRWFFTLLQIILFFSGGLLAVIGMAVLWNVFLSRNHSWINPDLAMETWPVTQDRQHNSNVDMIAWRSAFYLVHAVSPYHFGTKNCQLVVKRSTDMRSWLTVAQFSSAGEDIRDPKFSVIRDRLFLYVLVNKEVQPRPYNTKVTWMEEDGNWTELHNINQEGWLFWRQRSLDGNTWYAPAYWHQFGQTALFTTQDGINFDQTAVISQQQAVNETEITFLPGGEILAVARMEPDKSIFHQLFGSPRNCTLISTALPPYHSFSHHRLDYITRLDGPLLINAGGSNYAVGRSEPAAHLTPFQRGSAFKPKRTALYEIRAEGLRYLSDLPSAGDTSYAGAVVTDDSVYIAYYTGNILKDQVWFFSMLEPTEIRIIKIPLARLSAAGNKLTATV